MDRNGGNPHEKGCSAGSVVFGTDQLLEYSAKTGIERRPVGDIEIARGLLFDKFVDDSPYGIAFPAISSA